MPLWEYTKERWQWLKAIKCKHAWGKRPNTTAAILQQTDVFKLCIIAIHSPLQSTKHTVSYLSHNLLQKQNDSNAGLMFVMKAGQFIQGQPLYCESACALCRALNKSSCWDRMCTKPWRGRGDIKHCTQMGVTRHWSELTLPPACKTKMAENYRLQKMPPSLFAIQAFLKVKEGCLTVAFSSALHHRILPLFQWLGTFKNLGSFVDKCSKSEQNMCAKANVYLPEWFFDTSIIPETWHHGRDCQFLYPQLHLDLTPLKAESDNKNTCATII